MYAAPFVVDARCAQYECVAAAAIFYLCATTGSHPVGYRAVEVAEG